MDIQYLKSKIRIEETIKILNSLGADYLVNNDEFITFKTVCHCGNSHKLYFYKESNTFYCYTNCGSMDIITVVSNSLSLDLTNSIKYICNLLNIKDDNSSMDFGFGEEKNILDDWNYINSFKVKALEEHKRKLNFYDENLLKLFYKYYHKNFLKDNISPKTLDKFNIRFDILYNRIIIPHYSEDNKLVAIRSRNLDEDLIDIGLKYTPITMNRITYSSPTGDYLYGLNFNKDNIKRSKKIILFEAEKSVMQLDTFANGSGIGVALMGSSLSKTQVELIKSLSVEEVIICLDKEFLEYNTQQEKAYAMKVRKAIIDKLKLYFKVSVVWDKEGLLDYKDSPTDKGQDVFIKLFLERIEI